MASYKKIGSVYKKEPEWPGVLAAIVIIVLVVAIIA